MTIIYIIAAFVLGVIFHASAAALWKKWFPVVEQEVKDKVTNTFDPPQSPPPAIPPSTPPVA